VLPRELTSPSDSDTPDGHHRPTCEAGPFQRASSSVLESQTGPKNEEILQNFLGAGLISHGPLLNLGFRREILCADIPGTFPETKWPFMRHTPASSQFACLQTRLRLPAAGASNPLVSGFSTRSSIGSQAYECDSRSKSERRRSAPATPPRLPSWIPVRFQLSTAQKCLQRRRLLASGDGDTKRR
jgi:hypothetical protein